MNDSIALQRPAHQRGFLDWSVRAVRWLLGVQCLMSGINWWVKILPFPNIFDPADMPVKAAIVRTMIDSGWMFTAAKMIEVALGLALLSNRFVPLMLLVSFPVIFMTFMLDAMIGPTLLAWFAGTASNQALWAKFLDLVYFGGACLVMQIYLIISYWNVYRPLLRAKATPVDWSAS